MPGVPHEMKGMMTHDVIPQLLERFDVSPVLHRTLLTAGIGESFLAERISEFEAMLPKNIKLAYLPSYGMVKLRLTTMGDRPGLEAELEAEFDMLKQQVTDVMVVDADKTLPQVVAELLLERRQTLATAESCTGGYIAHLFTSIPGISECFQGGIVSYSNALKVSQLGVQQETLKAHGAVSRETVLEMASGARTAAGSDYAIATSGIMGPGGGTTEKSVGTVWVGLAGKDREAASQFHFRFDRMRNIELTAMHGLNALRKFILE